MRITIEPDFKDKDNNLVEKHETVVYDNVAEFAFVGTYLKGGAIPAPLMHTHGSTSVLMGKMSEMIERLHQVELSTKFQHIEKVINDFFKSMNADPCVRPLGNEHSTVVKQHGS